MPGKFIDSNVILYVASGDAQKAEKAERLLNEGGMVSVQVLNEIANVARRKMGVSFSELHEFLDLIRALVKVAPVTVAQHELGLKISEKHQLSIFDSMLVAAASTNGCDKFYSEDMHHGLTIDGTTIVNPFRNNRGSSRS